MMYDIIKILVDKEMRTMDNEVIKELKEVLNIKEWSEIKSREQFSDLVSYMYSIDDKILEEIVMSIDNLEMVIEEYFNECIDLIIDLEPSIMVAFVDTNSYIMEMFEKDDKPEIRKKIAYELKNFSKWLMVDSKVKYVKENESFYISVFTALTIIKANTDDQNIKLFLVTEKRQNLLKDLQELVRYGIDFGDSPYFSTGIDAYGNAGYYEDMDDYEEDYYLN